jgi:hypothetical protein
MQSFRSETSRVLPALIAAVAALLVLPGCRSEAGAPPPADAPPPAEAGSAVPQEQAPDVREPAAAAKAAGDKPLAVGGRTIYVATDGDDASADPTDIKTPLRTIQKAASMALAGDTVVIRGGTYRETVAARLAASAEHPVLFRPYRSEKVVVSGADVVAGPWENVDGHVWATLLPDRFESRQSQSDQVFCDGRMLHVARHPNFAPHGEVMQPGSWMTVDRTLAARNITGENEWGKIAKGGAASYTIECAELAELKGPWDDATVWIKPEEHGVSWGFGHVGPIIRREGKKLEFNIYNEVGEFSTVGRGIRFFLYDKREALDAPGEWWLDRKANRLYVWLPADADPNEHTIEVKRRDYAFDLSLSSYVTLKGIHVFAATITTDNLYSDGRGGGHWLTGNRDSDNPNVAQGNAPAHHITLDGVRAKYVSHFIGTWGFLHGQWTNASGIQLVGTDHVMNSCAVEYSAGNGVSLFGHRHKVINCIIHDVAYSAAHSSGIFFSHGRTVLPTDYEIAHNTIYRAGWGLIDCSNLYSSDPRRPSRVHHNFLDAPGLLTKDVGGIRFVGHTKPPHEVNGTRVDHNVVRGCVAALGNAIYFDFNNNYVADHNIVSHSTNMMNINDAHDIVIANNTGHTLQGGIGGNPKRTKFRNVVVRNNLTNCGLPRADRLDPAYKAGHNLVARDFSGLVVNAPAGDFRPKNGSKLIDAGLTVPPLTDGFSGKAPDIGALEAGGDDWTKSAGADWALVKAPSHLQAAAKADGTVRLRWKDNSDNEAGFVAERGYKTDHPNGGWEYIIAARVGANVTEAEDRINGPYREYFYRVRTRRSRYSAPVVLKAGNAGRTKVTFERDQGFAPGDLDGQQNWIGVDGGRGLGMADPKAFHIAGRDGGQCLKIVGDSGNTSVAALGSLALLDDAFKPRESRLSFSFKVALARLAEGADKGLFKLAIGGVGFWRGPGDDLVAFEVTPDGTVKCGWMKVAKLREAGKWYTVSGILDVAKGRVEDLTVAGKRIDVNYKSKPGKSRIENAYYQLHGRVKDPGQAVMLDDLTLTVAASE